MKIFSFLTSNKSGTSADKTGPDRGLTNEQALSIACYIFVVGVIGIPLWWKTTEVYRVHVPHGDIKALQDFRFVNKIPIKIFLTGETPEFERLPAEISSLTNDDVEYIPQEFHLPANWTQLTNSFRTLESFETKGLEFPQRKDWNEMPGVIRIWEMPSDSINMKGRDVVIGARRNVFLRGRHGVASPYLIPTLLQMIGDSSLRRIKYSGHGDDGDVDAITRVHSSGSYDVIFSLVNPDPAKIRVPWKFPEMLQAYLRPFIDHLEGLAEFNIESQNMYEAAVVNAGDMRRSGGIFWSQEHRCFIFPDTLSSQIITRLESKLGSFLSTNPALQFVLYINHYKENQGPLKIGRVGKTGYEFSPTNAFISPRWGGFLIANEVVRNISAQTDLRMSGREVMSVFIAQLRRLLGFPSLKLFNELEPNAVGTNKMGIQSSRGWELDQLKRIRTLENTLGSIDTLTALSDLLDEIGNLVIRDEIGTEIQKAVSSIRAVHEFLENSDLENAFRASLVALESSDKAFFDESLLELLYFPGDQKYAVYIPLFLPVGIPVISSILQLWRWWRSKKP